MRLNTKAAPTNRPRVTKAEIARPVPVEGTPEDRIAKALDDPTERVEPEQPAPAFGKKADRIDNRRQKHQHLDRERQRITDVAVLHVQRRCPNAECRRRQGRQHHERHQHQQAGVEADAVEGHDRKQHERCDRDVHQARSDGSGRHQQPGKINLGDEISARDQTVGTVGYRGGEKVPRQQSRIRKYCVGLALGRHASRVVRRAW